VECQVLLVFHGLAFRSLVVDMAITYVNFQPSPLAPFIFSAVFDGIQYNISVTWNLTGLRYYVNIYGTDGTLVLCAPNVGSQSGYDINLVSGYFTSTLVFRTLTNKFEVSDSTVIYNPVLGQTINNIIPGNILDYNFVLDESILS